MYLRSCILLSHYSDLILTRITLTPTLTLTLTFFRCIITDADTEIMYDLKAYLESTDSVIPQQLAKHASAQQPPGISL